ncbi:transmembrane 220 family protein [Sulfuriroseicoccus oceanibius]|uniref:Transmembrane 220 family protein n=2 Tax=Sulfuriroseicoccus oceanibius TaxID=2707525 RepID=A0A6B3L6X1_9BACT|nr:transmembrane 220 family protein [Sulfuriroseicoccus oceanibius]
MNDPDPLYWIVVYLLVAGVAVARFMGRRMDSAVKVVVGMVIAGLLVSGPGVVGYLTSGDFNSIYGQMAMERPYIESVREFLGLFVAGLYLVLAGVRR